MEVNKELKDEIWNYCRANDITNIDGFMIKCLKQGFTVEKFGATPSIKEKIVEKIVEVPIEKIIEKEIFISDDEELLKLKTENSELLLKIKDMEILLKKQKDELTTLQNKQKRDFYGE
jgi:hypothetical protein